MDSNVFISSAVGTLIGALVGSAIALVATYKSHAWQVAEQKQNEAELIRAVLQAIHDEVETLWEAYMDNAGARLEALPAGVGFDFYYPVTQEYFTIYTMNAFLIGRIPDPDLRKAIVLTYSKARGLIDSYRFNNEQVQKHEYAFWMWQETQLPAHQQRANLTVQAMVQYATELKKDHAEIKQQVHNLLRLLRKEGVLNKPKEKA